VEYKNVSGIYDQSGEKGRVKKIITILIMLIISNFATGSNRPLIAIISKPCEFNEKVISTSGYMRFFETTIENETFGRVYIDKNSAMYLINENSVSVTLKRKDIVQRELWKEHYVTIVGLFNCHLARAHEPDLLGGFSSVSRIIILSPQRLGGSEPHIVKSGAVVSKEISEFLKNLENVLVDKSELKNALFNNYKSLSRDRLAWIFLEAPQSIKNRLNKKYEFVSTYTINDPDLGVSYLSCFSNTEFIDEKNIKKSGWNYWSADPNASFCLEIEKDDGNFLISDYQFF